MLRKCICASLSILHFFATLPCSRFEQQLCEHVLTIPHVSQGEKQDLPHSSPASCRSRGSTSAGAFEKTPEPHMHQLVRHVESTALTVGVCASKASSQKLLRLSWQRAQIQQSASVACTAQLVMPSVKSRRQ